MKYDYNKLKGRIKERLGTQAAFAMSMGFSEKTISLKLNGVVAWKQPEIYTAIKLLNLSEEDIPEYFFTIEVQDIEPEPQKVS